MNRTKLNALDAYKECAGNGCSNPGRNLLKIRYIKRQGYFCDSCAQDLLQNELAIFLKKITSLKIQSSHNADKRQRGQETPLAKEESNIRHAFPDSRIRAEVI